ncbi:MAG: hypothetical protein WCH34_11420 [Bacteroidota bacterium]
MENTKKLRTIIIIEAIVIIILAILLITQTSRVNTIVVQQQQTAELNTGLKTELDSLMKEHTKIKEEYGNLTNKLSAKDSLIQADAQEIEKLINSQADYNKIKKKLSLLRNMTQGYISQIDSLYRVNKQLNEENTFIKGEFTKEKDKTQSLVKDKDELTEKVNLAAVLKAYNVTAQPIRMKSSGKKEEAVDKARRVEKIKICFTLAENPVAKAGNRMVYIRIARPDNKIVTMGSEDVYSFMFKGQRLQYSIKKEVDYQNAAMNVCMYWEKQNPKEEAMKGVYKVNVFLEDTEIGQGQFELK